MRSLLVVGVAGSGGSLASAGRPPRPHRRKAGGNREVALGAGRRAGRGGRTPAVDPQAPDEELLTRVATGDRGAFELLYRRYARPVLGLALRRLGDRGRAEDAVQE